MKTLLKILLVISLASCSKNGDISDKSSAINAKVEELTTLKKQVAALNDKIDKIEEELIQLDPSRGIQPKLVATAVIEPEGFKHFIDLQGMISSTATSYVAPRNGVGGYVRQIYVKAGDHVKKGQLLLRLDDAVLQQGIETLKTQYKLAKDVYDRTKALWDQGIGSEVQLLTAKTNMDALDHQIKTQQEQAKTFLVYADQTGVADIVNIKVGELFTGMTALGPQIQIVSNQDFSVFVDVPENYTGKIKAGAKVEVEIPALDKKISSTIFRLSQSINPNSRAYTAEIKVPSVVGIKPNMVAYVHILNHANANAIVVPINIIQSDDKGKYIFVMEKEGERNVAKKRHITIGQLTDDNIEVLSGLKPGDVFVTQGYQSLYEGQVITDKSITL
ncbi:MAG: efflux RND transporter periplasmic adaptor subunit [Saprospiraceae bacterium]|nr:MAG: RND family efflux transporter MFP subunit [Bacteroidetes bacterium OLB9]MCO6463276.1 efflux RND transporter periplasmic adaptor subunit [Saprospiraceae bacterium]MCZ2339756.1 efflux RND transporter periplasmic adaptor subunit [Chitinophagales bacterium]